MQTQDNIKKDIIQLFTEKGKHYLYAYNTYSGCDKMLEINIFIRQ